MSTSKQNILYICDRRACDKCSPECHHTSDPTHAVNFTRIPNGDLVEKHPADSFDDDFYFANGHMAIKDPSDQNYQEPEPPKASDIYYVKRSCEEFYKACRDDRTKRPPSIYEIVKAIEECGGDAMDAAILCKDQMFGVVR